MSLRYRLGAAALGLSLLASPFAGPSLAVAQPTFAPAHGSPWSPPAQSLPFSEEQLSATYASDTGIDYVPMLDGFSDLVANHPDVLESNLAQTIAVNHAATPAQQQRAIVDQYADMAYSMADGLGTTLGAFYLAALEDGRLPKTQALVSKVGGPKMVGWPASTEPAKRYFAYPRPYLAAPEDIVRYDKEGGNAYATTSGAFPSGHTSQAYWQGTTLATLLPELAPQILARTAEAGHHRVIMGVHYPLDIIGGRMMGQKATQLRWADPEYRTLLNESGAELRAVLQGECGKPLTACIAADDAYLSTGEALDVYRQRMTYGFGQIYPTDAELTVPSGAEDLLLTSHPGLTADQRRQVLELTAIPAGYPLDNQSEAGSWQRLDLAAAMSASVRIAPDGSVRLITGR